MATESFLDGCVRELTRLRRLGEAAMAQMSDDAFFRPPEPPSNSAALLVKHLAGNMYARWNRFLVGPADDSEGRRDRDLEFELDEEADTREALHARWDLGWRTLLSAIESLDEEDFARVVLIRDESHTVLQAIQRQLVHCAYHVGQIVFVARLAAGASWHSLSIPKGQSRAFRAKGGNYLSQ